MPNKIFKNPVHVCNLDNVNYISAQSENFNGLFALKNPLSLQACNNKFDITKLTSLHVLFGSSSIVLNSDYTHLYSKNTEMREAIKKAKIAGGQAARLGFNMLSQCQLNRKYGSQAERDAYSKAYEKASGNKDEQIKRRICLAGYQAAMYGCNRPSEEKLIKRGYTKDQIIIYYNSYDQTIGTEEEQLIRRIKRIAYQMAKKDPLRPSQSYLLKKGFDDKAIEMFYEIFDKTVERLHQ